MIRLRPIPIPLVMLAVCFALWPAVSPVIGLEVAAWITPMGGHLLLALGLLVACLLILNRVVLGLYQEFINRE